MLETGGDSNESMILKKHTLLNYISNKQERTGVLVYLPPDQIPCCLPAVLPVPTFQFLSEVCYVSGRWKTFHRIGPSMALFFSFMSEVSRTCNYLANIFMICAVYFEYQCPESSGVFAIVNSIAI